MKKTKKQSYRFEATLLAIGEMLAELGIVKGYMTQEEFSMNYDFQRIQYWRMETGKANMTL